MRARQSSLIGSFLRASSKPPQCSQCASAGLQRRWYLIMATTLNLSAQAATLAWDDLAKRLEQFIATWDAGNEPTLADFLPPDPPGHRRMVLVELVKVDLEQ